MWTFTFLEQLAQDLRYAFRAMAANPLFTATAVLSLALGIGANTAIYSFMDAILMRALPVAHPEQLVVAEWHSPRRSAVVKSINGSARRYCGPRYAEPQLPVLCAYRLLGAGEGQFFHTVRLHLCAELQRDRRRAGGNRPRRIISPATISAALVFRPPPGDCSTIRTTAPALRRRGPLLCLLAAALQRRPPAVGQRSWSTICRSPWSASPRRDFSASIPKANPAFYMPIHVMPSLAIDPADEERSRFLDDHFYWIEMMGRLRPGVKIQQAQAAKRARFHAFAAGTADNTQRCRSLARVVALRKPARASIRCAANTPSRSTC